MTPAPAIMRGLCIYCRFAGSARGADHVVELLKAHGWWCAVERAREAAIGDAQPPQEPT